MGVPTFHEFVSLSLGRSAPEGVFRYLIVDTAATRPLHVPRACGIEALGIDLLSGGSSDWHASASPVLIELPRTAIHTGTVADTLERWRYANCFLYLESLHDAPSIAAMLSARTQAVLPGNMQVVLRYFDARVLSALVQVLKRDQLAAFLAAASVWAFPDRRGALQVLRSEAEGGCGVFVPPLAFDAEHEARLIDAGEADSMIDLLLNQNHPILLAMLPPEQFERVAGALARSKSLGVDRLTEQVAYCSLELELGSDFADREPWAESMRAVKARQVEFSELIARVAA